MSTGNVVAIVILSLGLAGWTAYGIITGIQIRWLMLRVIWQEEGSCTMKAGIRALRLVASRARKDGVPHRKIWSAIHRLRVTFDGDFGFNPATLKGVKAKHHGGWIQVDRTVPIWMRLRVVCWEVVVNGLLRSLGYDRAHSDVDIERENIERKNRWLAGIPGRLPEEELSCE